MTIKETLNLLLIYFLSHGATLFFFDAKFYDDIYFYSWSQETLITEFSKSGDFLNNRIYIWLISKSFSPPKLYYFIHFIFHLIYFSI